MPSTLPTELQQAAERYLTSEFVTIDAAGRPIAWPVTPYYRPDAGCIDVTTGVGYPKKADDAARNPHVALLFSDPTGSGVADAPAVLVQGTARVDDQDLEANRERYEREMARKLPALHALAPTGPLKRFFSWYYDRIYLHVRPERVYVWAHGELNDEPTLYDAHVEEVRSGHNEEPEEGHAPPEGGLDVWDPRLDRLGTEDLTWQRSYQVRGDLVEQEGRLVMHPHRVVAGLQLPSSAFERYRVNVRKILRFRKTARDRERSRARAH